MKIIQLLPSLRHGDAVSNDAMEMARILNREGYETFLYADMLGENLGADAARPAVEMPEPEKEDILLYHLSTGSRLHEKIPGMKCHKIFVYHNITPPDFFRGYNPYLEKKCREGLEEAGKLSGIPDYVLAVSEYNKADLIRMGYSCPIDVVPILIPGDKYEAEPDSGMLRRLRDGHCNILFTGRIAPNKKHENLIAAFYVYQRNFNPDARLILAGGAAGNELYLNDLKKYAMRLGLTERDICFTGHISQAELNACYRAADVFLCFSEHEGFCVPLLEAMHFGLPVIALDRAAVAETLGGCGILLQENSPSMAAAVIDVVYREKQLREQLIDGQNRRLACFREEAVEAQFLECLKKYIGKIGSDKHRGCGEKGNAGD